MARRRSRSFLTIAAIVSVVAALTVAFWPRPIMVYIGTAKRGLMQMSIDEEGRTRVHDTYVVSTPVSGLLLRVDVQAGDKVVAGVTEVARMSPANPDQLNLRDHAQALADVAASEASLRLAKAELSKAVADQDLALSELHRLRSLRADSMASEAELDKAKHEARSADAQLGTAQAAVAMREAELNKERARLISYRDMISSAALQARGRSDIPILAPISGRVLRVVQESESTLPAGTALLEIGNIENDLEVVIELLSSDAVRVEAGQRVLLEDWGGPVTLKGVVERVNPWGFTKYSALGVEEQRVEAVVRFVDPPDARKALGHGYRVEARIIVWEEGNVLMLPSSALFRDGDGWAVFAVKSGKIQTRRVEIGHNNGVDAQVLDGVTAGERVILYPAPGLGEGVAVRQRLIE